MGKVDASSGLKICVLSWNMANAIVSEDDIDRLTQKLDADVILVEAQEETRDCNNTLARRLLAKLNTLNPDLFSQALTTSFNIVTDISSPGRVSSTVLVKKGVSCLPTKLGEYCERDDGALFANKGGLVNHLRLMRLGKNYRLNVVSAHLASKNDAKKINEATELLALMQPKKVASFDDLELISADLDLFVGDLNYRNIFKSERCIVSPYHNVDGKGAVTQHFTMRGFKLPNRAFARKITYSPVPEARERFSSKLASRKSKSRSVGVSGDAYCQSGCLDLVLYRAATGVVKSGKSLVVIEDITSAAVDHRPVKMEFELLNPQCDFDRTKCWVASLLVEILNHGEGCYGIGVIKKINNAKDNAENRAFIANAYNYYVRVGDLQVQGEYFRAQGEAELSLAINGDTQGHRGLTGDLITVGNRYFSGNIEALKFESKVNQVIRDAYRNTPRLKSIVSIWLQLKDIVYLVFTFGHYRVTPEAKAKIDLIKNYSTLFSAKRSLPTVSCSEQTKRLLNDGSSSGPCLITA